jgi:type I restriction enzyme S subunit
MSTVSDHLQPYPEYKHSGVAWLGPVPSHWEIRRLKSTVANIVEHTSSMDGADVYVALEHVESWTGRVRPDRGESHFIGQVKRFERDDVLFGKLRPYLAKVARLPVRGVCVGEFFVLRSGRRQLLHAFLENLLRCKHTIDVINGSTFGAKMPRADWQFVGNLQICVPPPDEQSAIVRFLDWANGRLERAIRAKRKVIALLNEEKQAIIHRAVTRGSDPTVPLKPSGIAWLGEIPEHWEVIRSRYLFREVVDTGYPKARLLSIDRFKGVIPQDETGRRTRAAEDRINYKRVRPGQLAYNLMNAFMGAIGFSAYDGIVSPAYAVAKPSREIEPLYFHNLLRTPLYTGENNRLSYGIMYERNRLYFHCFKLVPILVPPLPEQHAIIRSIAENTMKLETAIDRAEREIGLLREYRLRLIADVVTGKLDVRAASRHLPLETEEPPAPIVAEDFTDEAELELASSGD